MRTCQHIVIAALVKVTVKLSLLSTKHHTMKTH